MIFIICRSFVEESISESKQKGRDRSFQRPSASNASRLLLPDTDDGPLDKNEFLTTFLKPRLIASKANQNSTITANKQQDRTVSQLNPHNDINNEDDDEGNNEIQATTREHQLTSISNVLDSKSSYYNQ
jgi:hypothetical protein